jgi:hypothetical protein
MPEVARAKWISEIGNMFLLHIHMAAISGGTVGVKQKFKIQKQQQPFYRILELVLLNKEK